MHYSALILFMCILDHALAQTCPPVEQRDAEVLVFGAGVTGITTARALYDNGLTSVLVLEAGDHIGGRMRNVEFGGVQVELGANWIQLAPKVGNKEGKSNPIWTLAHSTDICPMIFTSLRPLANNFSNYDNYTVFDENGHNITTAFQTACDAYNQSLTLAEKYSIQLQFNDTNDITMRTALEKFHWTPSNPTEDVTEWYEFDFCFAELPDMTSLFGLFPAMKHYEFGNTDYFVTDQRGYSSVVDCIAEGFPKANIRLGHTVSYINYNDDCVCASVLYTNGTERTMCGTYGVATFSVGVLKDFVNRSLFDPQLSTSKLNFIKSIHMAYYLKIFVSFPTTFWNPNVEYIIRSDTQRGRYPVIQPLNLLPGNPNIILITVTGNEAVRISNQNINATKSEIMEVLREVYGDHIPEPDDILVPTWINDPLYRGMYSNTSFGMTIEDQQRFGEPEGNLFLSGEANIVGYNGFVHSGYCSGMEASGAILQATGRPSNRSNLPRCQLSGATRGVASELIIALATITIAATLYAAC